MARVLLDVEHCYWYRGCGPTAVVTVLGYWDAQGYANLIPGTWQDACATQEHYESYSMPLDSGSTGIKADKSTIGGAHENNCIADWYGTSQSMSGLVFGWSRYSKTDDAFIGYTHWRGYGDSESWSETWGLLTWDDVVDEIDAGRPMVFLVDTSGNGSTDHFVACVGYDDVDFMVAYRDSNASSIRWKPWRRIGTGAWGIYGATFFLPGTPDALNSSPSASPSPSQEGTEMISGLVVDKDSNGVENAEVWVDDALPVDTDEDGEWGPVEVLVGDHHVSVVLPDMDAEPSASPSPSSSPPPDVNEGLVGYWPVVNAPLTEPNSEGWNMEGAFTIAARLHVTSIPTGTERNRLPILSKYAASSKERGFEFVFNDEHKNWALECLALYVSVRADKFSGGIYVSNSKLEVGVDYHVAVVYVPNMEPKLYVDGQHVPGHFVYGGISGRAAANGLLVKVAADYDTGGETDGLSDVRLYNRALTPSEIVVLSNN